MDNAIVIALISSGATIVVAWFLSRGKANESELGGLRDRIQSLEDSLEKCEFENIRQADNHREEANRLATQLKDALNDNKTLFARNVTLMEQLLGVDTDKLKKKIGQTK